MIIKFVKDCEAGTVERYLKTEEIPEEGLPGSDVITTVVGKNVVESIFREDADVFFQVGAPWCGHCQRMKPDMDKLGRKIKKDGYGDILKVMYMDSSRNDCPD